MEVSHKVAGSQAAQADRIVVQAGHTDHIAGPVQAGRTAVAGAVQAGRTAVAGAVQAGRTADRCRDPLVAVECSRHHIGRNWDTADWDLDNS